MLSRFRDGVRSMISPWRSSRGRGGSRRTRDGHPDGERAVDRRGPSGLCRPGRPRGTDRTHPAQGPRPRLESGARRALRAVVSVPTRRRAGLEASASQCAAPPPELQAGDMAVEGHPVDTLEFNGIVHVSVNGHCHRPLTS